MHLGDAIRLALGMLRAQKLKSAFALIGVFVGVMFLIAVVSIIEGMDRYMTDQFASRLVGVNTFQLRRRPDIVTGDLDEATWREWARRPGITYEDAEVVAASLDGPVITAWQSSARADLVYRGRTAKDIEVTGATENYFEIKNLLIEQGRAFSPQEARAGLPVLVLGSDLAERLFDGQDPLGKEVRIHGLPYRVIGVVERQGNLFGMSLDKFVVAPALSPVRSFVNPPRVLDALLVRGATLDDMHAAMDQAETIMRSRRHLRPQQANNFALETADGVLAFWGQIKTVMLAVFPMIVGVSLVVGGIVIMNIMLMAVAERTREIGLRKSLGARRRDIMRQFVAESIAIATAGSIIGVGCGLGLAALVDRFTALPASVAPWSIGVGIVLGAGVGIIAGVYPASRAARLDPIVALRAE